METNFEPAPSPCLVVQNDDAQFSVWPADQVIPAGWRAAGYTGTRAACLDRIETIWTDLRPLSLQRKLAPR